MCNTKHKLHVRIGLEPHLGAFSHSQSPMRVMRRRGKCAIENKIQKKSRRKEHYIIVGIGLTAPNKRMAKCGK
jgi:hypothetical protein